MSSSQKILFNLLHKSHGLCEIQKDKHALGSVNLTKCFKRFRRLLARRKKRKKNIANFLQFKITCGSGILWHSKSQGSKICNIWARSKSVPFAKVQKNQKSFSGSSLQQRPSSKKKQTDFPLFQRLGPNNNRACFRVVTFMQTARFLHVL